MAVIVAVLLLILWPKLREQTRTPPTKDSAQTKGTTPACPPGPYTVSSGMPTKIDLNVGAGSKVRGFVREVNGDFFDWYIVDEDNMLRFLKGELFTYLDGEENVQASKVKCRMHHAGPWYLMLDLGNRRQDREVEAGLRVLPD